MEAAVELVLIPGSNAREGHFGETNPRCRNATCLSRGVQSRHRALLFPCYLQERVCHTEPMRAQVVDCQVGSYAGLRKAVSAGVGSALRDLVE
jgi:hypothetical protein